MLKRITCCTLLTLAISACAPSGDDGDDAPAGAPFGYELAHLDEQDTSSK